VAADLFTTSRPLCVRPSKPRCDTVSRRRPESATGQPECHASRPTSARTVAGSGRIDE
jgi:hypothetical protein